MNSEAQGVSVKKVGSFFIAVVLTIFSAFILIQQYNSADWSTFLNVCRYGTFIVIADFVLLLIAQNRVLTIPNIIYVFFALFQFGIPILYATKTDYHSFYSSLFQTSTLVSGAIYSIFSILILTVGFLSVLVFKKTGKKQYVIFEKAEAMRNYAFVKKASLIIFILTGLICLPLYTYVALQAIKNGFSQANRTFLSANGLFNLARAFFMPSCLLYMCFNETHDNIEKIIQVCFFYSCAVLLVSGTRDQSLGWLFAYLYNIYVRNTGHKLNKSLDWHKIHIKKLFRNLCIIVGIFGLIYLAEYVSANRSGNGDGSIDLYANLLNEMGFNFYSICFTKMYVPQLTHFQFGATYLKSLITLIPNSIDFLGISKNLLLPTAWLGVMNGTHYGSLLSFGVGFSFNAEAFMNFGWWGLILSFLLPWLLSFTFKNENNSPYGWRQYVILVIIEIMVTFPRRDFSESLSTVEYAIFFMGIYLMVLYGILRRNRD